MNYITKLLSLLTTVVLMLLTSCQKTPDNIDNSQTTLTFESETLLVDGNGGTYSVGYTLKNGIEGIDIAAQTEDAWIKNIRTENNRLYFDYDLNLGDKQRDGRIMVRYPNLSRKTLLVRQAVSDAIRFEMEITDIKTTSCSSNIKPSDPKTPYIVYMAEKDYLLSGNITDTSSLFLDDYNFFVGLAQKYGVTDLKSFMFSNNICFKGDSQIGWTGMVPNREYVLYAYAIEFNENGTDYTIASPIYHKIIILPTYVFEDIEFDVDITVDGPRAYYEFSPVDWDGYYYIDIYSEHDYMYINEGDTPSEAYCKQIADNWINIINLHMQSGYSPEQLINIMCLKGADSYDELRDADTAYCMVFYGIDMVDGLPQVVTKPYIAHFRTEAVGTSDMLIDIKVENCYVRVADLIITPTVDDDPYVATFLKKSDIPYSDNKEIIDWLVQYDIQSFTGKVTSNVIGLEPNTEYVVLAFGYYGGVVTTDLFRYDFKTEPEGVCENSVIGVTHSGPYSLVELEAAMPDTYYQYGMFESMGWYAMCAEIETKETDGHVFMRIYPADSVVTDGKDALEADLRAKEANNRTTLFTGENGKVYVLCAIAMDYRGNFSQMWMSEPFSYTLNTSTKRDINEFLDKMGLESEAQQASRSSVDLRLKL